MSYSCVVYVNLNFDCMNNVCVCVVHGVAIVVSCDVHYSPGRSQYSQRSYMGLWYLSHRHCCAFDRFLHMVQVRTLSYV